MTIQFLAQWNGNEAFSIKSLAASEETRLVAAGIARVYADAMDGGSGGAAVVYRKTGALDDASRAALGASGVGFGVNKKNFGLTTWPTGRVEATHAVDGANGTTFHQIFHIPAIADCFRFIYANGASSAYSVSAAAARPVVGSADFNNSGVAWSSTLSFAGSASGTVPARPAAGGKRAGYLVSDWLERSHVARSDGFGGTLIAVRTFVAAGAGTITVPGAASTDLTNWATNVNGEVYLARQQIGNHVATATGFTSTTNISYGPVIGVEYIARQQIITIAGAGDSTVEGAGVTYFGDGWGRTLCRQLTAERGVVYQWATLAWSGSTSPEYTDKLIGLLALGISPSVVVIAGGSINDTSSIVSGNVNQWRTKTQRMIAECKTKGVACILSEIQPANRTTSTPAGAKDYGATDQLRVDYNAELQTWMPGLVLPFGSVMAGATESSQVIIKDGYTTDGTHENDAGASAKASAAAEVFRRIT